MTRIRLTACVVGVAVVTMWAGVCAAAEGDAAGAAPVAVLDTFGTWHMRSMLAPPILASGEEGPLLYVWMAYRTPPPAEGWQAPDFDDRFWNRGSLVRVPKTGVLARACLRGKFTVTDPSAVAGLRFSAKYHGGLVVYLNGKEVHREHIASGDSLADGPGGEDRQVTDLPVPTDLLRKGTNVLALDVVRSAYPATGGQEGACVYDVKTCEIIEARLTAADASGLVPNATRPAGLQVWNADPLFGDQSLDQGDAGMPLYPVTIMAARNGLFSGKAVLGSSRPIRGLKVTPGDLTGPAGGVIPSGNVDVRYGLPWGDERMTDVGLYHGQWLRDSPYLDYALTLGALGEAPLAEFPVLQGKRQDMFYNFPRDPNRLKPSPGAVVPLWIRVKTPSDAAPGTYTGMVRVEADGEEPIEVPVEVRMADYALPDTQDFRTWVDIIECPDTLALEYDVPLWSERHWKMIADSFRLIGETGSRTVYVPLIVHTNFGNEESMVRWIKEGDGKYSYDFSIMDRYLDVATQNMGKPKIVIFVVWDVYMMPSDALTEAKRSRTKDTARNIEKIGGTYGMGPRVTVVDPATGQTEMVELPPHFDAEASRPLWKPLLDQLHERMAARGLEDAMMLGVEHDAWATEEEHRFFKEISGDLPWVMQSHEGVRPNTLQYGISKIGYQDVVWSVSFSDDGTDRGKRNKGQITSLCGWKRPDLLGQFDRVTRDDHPNTRWLQVAETCITGAQRGPGRLGGEYWKVVRNARGQRAQTSFERYPESSWRNLFIASSLLAPGPDGPVASRRLEAFREGVQECEARIAIERGLYDPELKAKLGDDLARRCEGYLHERHMMLWQSLWSMQCYWRYPEKQEWYEGSGWRTLPNVDGHNWFLGSGYQERNYRLFTLAGEVTRALE